MRRRSCDALGRGRYPSGRGGGGGRYSEYEVLCPRTWDPDLLHRAALAAAYTRLTPRCLSLCTWLAFHASVFYGGVLAQMCTRCSSASVCARCAASNYRCRRRHYTGVHTTCTCVIHVCDVRSACERHVPCVPLTRVVCFLECPLPCKLAHTLEASNLGLIDEVSNTYIFASSNEKISSTDFRYLLACISAAVGACARRCKVAQKGTCISADAVVQFRCHTCAGIALFTCAIFSTFSLHVQGC